MHLIKRFLKDERLIQVPDSVEISPSFYKRMLHFVKRHVLMLQSIRAWENFERVGFVEIDKRHEDVQLVRRIS